MGKDSEGRDERIYCETCAVVLSDNLEAVGGSTAGKHYIDETVYFIVGEKRVCMCVCACVSLGCACGAAGRLGLAPLDAYCSLSVRKRKNEINE